MVTILSRSRWTSTSARGSAINWSRVRGIVAHYPAMGRSVGVLSQSQEAARLRGWRSYHVNTLGWQDIGYSYAIGQSGRIYSLRGDRVGGHTYGHNSTTLGVLFIVGDNEPLTAAAKASFRALRATLRKRGASSGVWGHTEMSGNSTRCPGPYIMGSIRDGSLKGASSGTAPSPGTSKPVPSKPASPSGKLVVDGRWGRATTTALQEFLNAGTPRRGGSKLSVDGRMGPASWTALQHYLSAPYKDGKISRQSYRHDELGNGISPNGWEYTGRRSAGSQTIVLLQEWIRAGSDGIVGSGTSSALQRKLNEHGM